MKIKTMPAGVFKANCLAVMDEVKAKREPVIITKYGKAVAKLVPVETRPNALYNFMQGKGTIVGDVVSPVIPAKEWESD
jgi:prevent-host-death family protein